MSLTRNCMTANPESLVSAEIPLLSSSIHAFNCRRGQLLLSDEEAGMISSIIRPYGFSFELLPEEETKVQEQKAKRKTAVARPRRKTLIVQTGQPPDAVTPPTRARRSSVGTVENRVKRQKVENVSGRTAPGTQPTPAEGWVNSSVLRSPKTNLGTVPTRSSRRRREILEGRWEDACDAVILKMEADPDSRWFLTPVDPAADNVPDYLEKVKTPMDFGTIKQKLRHGMYSHPFRWQEDVRTIFYNAFIYHEPESKLWITARRLSELFDQLCKENEGVNPYAVYSGQIPGRRSTVDPTTPTDASTGIASRISQADSIIHQPMNENINTEDTITLDATKLRELLEKAAAVAHQHISTTDELIVGTGIGKGVWGSGKQQSKTNEISNTLAASTLRGGSPQQSVVRRILPPKGLPDPPPPPLAAGIKPGEKPSNSLHKRLAAVQFRDLDVHYRKAALEIVKDELGINPDESACDANYKIDLELLPFLKQKQLLNYFRILTAFQRKKLEDGCTVCLVNSLTNLAVDEVKEQSSSLRSQNMVQPNDHHSKHSLSTNVVPSSSSSSSSSANEYSSESEDESVKQQTNSNQQTTSLVTDQKSFMKEQPLRHSPIGDPPVVANGSLMKQQELESSSEETSEDDDDDEEDEEEIHHTVAQPSPAPDLTQIPNPTAPDIGQETRVHHHHHKPEIIGLLTPKPYKENISIESSSSSSEEEEEEDEHNSEAPDEGPCYSSIIASSTENPEIERVNGSDVQTNGEDKTDAESVTSAWGEWKAKLIQTEVRRKIQLDKKGGKEPATLSSITNLSSERAAELADAEI